MSNNLKLSFFGCSCVSIQTNNARIICDPWFDTAAYEGTWVPDIDISKWVNKIGDGDGIYVSHIHPDHYDPKSLSKYFNKYGKKKIFISEFPKINGVDRNWLKKKMIADGIDQNLITSNIKNFHKLKDLNLLIIPRDTDSYSDIDSSIIIYEKKYKNSVLNLNDFKFNTAQMKKIQKKIESNNLNNIITLYNYMSSGSWPQTHFLCTPKNKILKKNLNHQKKHFIERYFDTHKIIKSKFRLPFAAGAKYVGPLENYEKYRPRTKIEEIIKLDKNAVYIKPFGKPLDLLKLVKSPDNIKKYRPSKITENYGKNKHKHDYYDYEKTFQNLNYNKKILKTLFKLSQSRAMLKNEVKDKHILSIYAFPNWKIFYKKAFKNDVKNDSDYHIGDIKFNLENIDEKKKINKTVIFLHHKALFGALSGIVHWNNLELGAHKLVRRNPEVYNKDIVNFLNFFSIG